jgi:hypothetical protein
MSRSYWFAIPRWVRNVVPLVFAAVLGASPLAAQHVVKVQEDWELVLGQPDANSVGPQIAVTMSPFENIETTFFTFEINHRSAPTWQPGGLTIHRWDGEWRQESYDRADRSVMTTNNETVRWTQELRIGEYGLTFQIKDGTSSTWGIFGYTGMFKLHTWMDIENLDSYTPDVSVSQSGAAYAGNRVQSMKILQIRLTLDDGSVVTDNTVRTVHQLVE